MSGGPSAKMIPSQIIEEIRNKSDIVKIVSEYVKLRKTGKNYVGPCPFHSEKNPSFTVSQEKQLFHCFGCGEGGNVFAFIMKIENIGFAEAAEELGSKIGIAVSKPTASGVSRTEKEKLYEVTLLAAKFFRSSFEEARGQAARDYLRQRGIDEKTAKTFGLGYAPEGWDHLFRHLISRGVAPNLIEKAGLTLPREGKDGYYDRFRNRLMFPILDTRSRVIAFSGRSLKDEEPKYLNSPDTPIYHKGEIIFGLSLTKDEIKTEKAAVLVEGNLDLLSAYQAGITNVAAPLGTALTVSQCKLLARFADTVVLAFDADSAGGAATERSIELLRGQGLKVKVAELKGAKDPDELIRKAGPAALKLAIDAAFPFLEFKIKRVLARHNPSEIEARSRALREIAAILSQEGDAFVQKEYAKLAARPLKVDPDSILAEVKRQKFYFRGNDKDLRRVTEKPASKIIEAEKNLIALSVQNQAVLENLKNEMKIEEFSCPEARSIAELLYAADLTRTDNPSHFLLENLPDETAKNFLAKILVSENADNPETMFKDCLQVIKTERSKSKIEALKIELGEAEKAGESKKAAELLLALKNEIS